MSTTPIAAQVHLDTLRRAAALLSSSTEFEAALGNTIAACLPALGDFGFFDVSVGASVVRTARAHEDESTEALLRPTTWVRQERGDMNLCALSSGRTALHAHVDDAWYRAVAADDGHLALLRRLAFRSMITVPMRYAGELVGALTLFMGRSGRRHDVQHLALAEDIAALAAPVVVNVRLLAAERGALAQAEAAGQRLELLAQAGSAFSRSLDATATVQAIADLIVPAVADWCRVDLLDAQGLARPVLVRHRDRALAERVQALAHKWRAPGDAPGTIDWVIVNAQPYLGSVARDRLDLITDPEVAEVLTAMDVHSSLMVPLIARGRTIGAIGLLQAESQRQFEPADLAFVTELAQRAALALDNARLYQQAEAARHEAESASRAKDEFLAVLGHELRNPLAPIVTSLHLMDRRPGAEATAKERAIISRQLAHLSRLVDDLLDVSRIAQGRIELVCGPLDLAEVLSSVAESVQPAMERGQLACELALPPQPVIVRGDAIRLMQVFTNLLVNACKFTPPGGRITITLAVHGGWAEAGVRDTGIGISEALLPHVFGLFSQGPQAMARERGGLGLGLSIAKSLVALHGGEITAESAGAGQGSVFRVRLPLAPASPARQQAPHAAVAHAGAGGARVLVVDDNEDGRHTLAALLAQAGYEVQSAADGASALQAAARWRPQAGILDIGLPDMTGYELAQRLLADAAADGVKLVALTGYGREPDRERAQRAGFHRHLVKPVDPPALLATLAELLSAAPAAG